MNRFFSLLAAALLSASTAMAAQMLPDISPEALEPYGGLPTEKTKPEPQTGTEPETGQAEESGSLDWVENFVDPEGNAPEVDEGELRKMVPAVLSVERTV